MSGHATISRRAYIGRGKVNEFFGYVTDIAKGEIIYDEGEWSDLEAALTWARARADQVVLTYGTSADAVFSAGVTYYDGGKAEPMKAWPPSEEARNAMDADVRRHADGTKQSDCAQLGVAQPMVIRGGKRRRFPPEEKG